MAMLGLKAAGNAFAGTVAHAMLNKTQDNSIGEFGYRLHVQFEIRLLKIRPFL